MRYDQTHPSISDKYVCSWVNEARTAIDIKMCGIWGRCQCLRRSQSCKRCTSTKYKQVPQITAYTHQKILSTWDMFAPEMGKRIHIFKGFAIIRLGSYGHS